MPDASVVFGVTILQIGRKVLDLIRYPFMEQKTRRKEKEEKSGLNEAGTLDANHLLGCVFDDVSFF